MARGLPEPVGLAGGPGLCGRRVAFFELVARGQPVLGDPLGRGPRQFPDDLPEPGIALVDPLRLLVWLRGLVSALIPDERRNTYRSTLVKTLP